MVVISDVWNILSSLFELGSSKLINICMLIKHHSPIVRPRQSSRCVAGMYVYIYIPPFVTYVLKQGHTTVNLHRNISNLKIALLARYTQSILPIC